MVESSQVNLRGASILRSGTPAQWYSCAQRPVWEARDFAEDGINVLACHCPPTSARKFVVYLLESFVIDLGSRTS